MIKIKNAKLVYVSLFALSIAACATPTPREAAIAQRQQMIESFDLKLENLKKSIEESKVKLADAPPEARAKYQAEIEALTKHYEKAAELQRRMKESLKDAADHAWEGAKQSLDKVSEELASLQKDIRDSDRQEIIKGFETKLADLELKIEHGKKNLANASADVRAKFEGELAELDKKRVSASDKLIELKNNAKDGAADAWHKMKSGMDTAWDGIHTFGQKLFGNS
jgi:hypothetical protein